MPFSPKRAGSVAYSAAMFLVVSMVAGLLVAGLAVPVAAMAGVGGRAAEKTINDLPQEFQTPPQPVRTKVTMANGKTLAYFYDQDRTYVSQDKIAPIMREAQLAIEDHRFYEHGALDVTGTLRALLTNAASGGISQGGSSITQQYVKMVRIQEAQLAGDEKGIKAAQDDTYARKVQELKYAIGLEKKLSKDQILERYLNIAYYGDGAYGVEAAARHYFGTSAKKLDLAQAAMLAGLVQSPDSDNPVDHPEAAIARRNTVLSRMAELKIITAHQAAVAKKEKFASDEVSRTPNGCISSPYPFLCNYVYKSLLKMPSLGKTEQDRINTIKRGGLTIETAIDPKTQDAAQKSVSNYVGAKDPVIATMSMIQPGTGLIIGMAQSRPDMGGDEKKGETYYSYPAPSDLGGSPGGFQSGSTFKAITIATALEEGISPSKTRFPMFIGDWAL
jgi:membrane peptidoglycan carboxypeptidase